ncbi:amidohydrolase family protein [Yunchengibacter salinarum]|uniref:amidohydrolase family protein n=1 Tax=Yunchengibacter salinarum TaxID=3133399 RepID=UPI0035B57B8B
MRVSALLLAAAFALMIGLHARPSAADERPILFDNVALLTMTDADTPSLIPDGRLLVRKDRIRALGTAEKVKAPDNARIIDGGGATLMPGLAEMHGHLPYSSWPDERAHDTLFLYLAGGVTTVRGMLGDPVQFTLRDRIDRGDIAGPTLYLAAPSLNGRTVTSPEQAAKDVHSHSKAGWDLQKIHPGLSVAEYDAIAAASAEAGLPFGGHVPQPVGVPHALESGQISIDHMDGYMAWLNGADGPIPQARLQEAAERTARAGTWIVPTQALFNLFRGGGDPDRLMQRDELAYVDAATLRDWREAVRQANLGARPIIAENRQRLLKAMADAGANIALGSDAPQVFSVPGFSIRHEVAAMKAAGLTNAQILASATSAAGRYFEDKDSFGTLTPGARADLILVDGKPQKDIQALFRLKGVMAAGRWLDRATLDRRLEAIAARRQ